MAQIILNVSDETLNYFKRFKLTNIGDNKNIDAITEAIKNSTDYETRLKADMVAMLEDLDLQIDESAAYNLEVAKVQRLIRDRINKLKEDKK